MDNVADHINCFEQDDFVKIRGLLNKFNGRFQLTVHKVRSMQESKVDCFDYLPRTTKDIGELWQTVKDFVDGFRDPHLQALVRAFMADPEIEHAYKNCSRSQDAASCLYIGGLLDHVVSCSRSCDLACRNYPEKINRDLLLTGAFLHDIGKIHELTFERSFTYTTRGQLLGHMIIELEMLQEERAQVPGFPTEYKTLIEHLIISHHGKYEFGSPKLPMFPEALMLHYLDDLDSKMESMRAHFQREPEAEWTTYNTSLARPLLNSKKFLEKMKAGNGALQPCSPMQLNPMRSSWAIRPNKESSKAAAAKEK